MDMFYVQHMNEIQWGNLSTIRFYKEILESDFNCRYNTNITRWRRAVLSIDSRLASRRARGHAWRAKVTWQQPRGVSRRCREWRGGRGGEALSRAGWLLQHFHGISSGEDRCRPFRFSSARLALFDVLASLTSFGSDVWKLALPHDSCS